MADYTICILRLCYNEADNSYRLQVRKDVSNKRPLSNDLLIQEDYQ